MIEKCLEARNPGTNAAKAESRFHFLSSWRKKYTYIQNSHLRRNRLAVYRDPSSIYDTKIAIHFMQSSPRLLDLSISSPVNGGSTSSHVWS